MTSGPRARAIKDKMYIRKVSEMQRLVLFFIALLGGVLWGCSSNSSFTINGQLENAGGVQTVALYEGERKLDSVFLTENGRFKFTRVSSQPRLFTLRAGGQQYDFIAQNGETIDFKADLMAEAQDYEISGSELSAKIKEFAKAKNDRDRFELQLDEEFIARRVGLDDQALNELRQELLQRHREGTAAYVQAAVDFANRHDDLAGFFAMSTLDPDVAEQEIIAYADRIAGRFEDNALVQQFREEAARIKLLAVGQPAPDFESLTPTNQPVRLSDFRGKYTLLDFWASWCVPCREENPNIVNVYNRYKDRGFTVFGVSLDGNPGLWLRAIEADGLAWTQASDLQQWGSEVVGLYRIKAIPASYLLDPDGIILAKDLRGEDLERVVSELLD